MNKSYTFKSSGCLGISDNERFSRISLSILICVLEHGAIKWYAFTSWNQLAPMSMAFMPMLTPRLTIPVGPRRVNVG